MPTQTGVIRRCGLAGTMRETFTIVEYVATADTLGAGGTKTRTVRYSGVRGRLNDLSAKEIETGKRLEMESTHELQVWSRGITLKPGYVFELNGTARVFQLKAISQYENRDEVYKLRIKEYEIQERPNAV